MADASTRGASSVLLSRVSVPGKAILMGEHAAVRGRPALVAAVGLRLRVDITAADQDGLTIRIGGSSTHGTDWPAIQEFTRQRRTGVGVQASTLPAQFVMLALGEAADALRHEGVDVETAIGAFDVRVDSQLPVGAGLGSSAAAAMGVVAALCAAAGASTGWNGVGAAANEVEKHQHGTPSGIDAATVFHGGVLRTWREGGVLRHGPATVLPKHARSLRLFHTGTPAESTGVVVAEVGRRARENAREHEAILDTMELMTEEFEAALAGAESAAALIHPVRAFERDLERLGVVPGPVRDLVRQIEKAGGAAKVSGAGSLAGPAGGLLLVVDPEGTMEPTSSELPDLAELHGALGVEGLRVEVAAGD